MARDIVLTAEQVEQLEETGTVVVSTDDDDKSAYNTFVLWKEDQVEE